jgi:hypothetical protein
MNIAYKFFFRVHVLTLFPQFMFCILRKLIGVRYFNKGFAALAGVPLNNSYIYNTVRDNDGHGTHTLSTAGGNFVAGASILGNANGTAKSGSPKARVAAYKVCWSLGTDRTCADADILAAFEAAISDGVDVLSVSLGASPKALFKDVVSLGAFHAVKNGIVVVCSAGNDGPAPGTVTNVAPWIFTVGASTLDREFSNYVALGNRKKLKVLLFLLDRSCYILTWKGIATDIPNFHISPGNKSFRSLETC